MSWDQIHSFLDQIEDPIYQTLVLLDLQTGLSPNPPTGVGRALEQDITGMERRPTRRIWDGRGQ